MFFGVSLRTEYTKKNNALILYESSEVKEICYNGRRPISPINLSFILKSFLARKRRLADGDTKSLQQMTDTQRDTHAFTDWVQFVYKN